MLVITHRINTLSALSKLPLRYGVEIDVRRDNTSGRLYLNHDQGQGQDLDKYLQQAAERFIIFNIKEAGIEQACVELADKYLLPGGAFGKNTKNYFLLDVEFPYFYKASRQGQKNLAARYSEAEPIEFAQAHKNFVDWIWIDVITKLPLDAKIINKLRGFKTCLVSPECWGRPRDIAKYQKQMQQLNFQPTAVMCDPGYEKIWEQFSL
jgi:hypothetical protein